MGDIVFDAGATIGLRRVLKFKVCNYLLSPLLWQIAFIIGFELATDLKLGQREQKGAVSTISRIIPLGPLPPRGGGRAISGDVQDREWWRVRRCQRPETSTEEKFSEIRIAV